MGFLRFFLLKIRRKEISIIGKCEGCGSCCNMIHLRYEKGWIYTLEQFEEVKAEMPEYNRFIPVNQDKFGLIQFTCSWLTSENVCSNYEERLAICRKYPTKSLYFCGGILLKDCGYSFQEVVPFERYLKKALRKRGSEKDISA